VSLTYKASYSAASLDRYVSLIKLADNDKDEGFQMICIAYY
jgi:hypothetical protein